MTDPFGTEALRASVLAGWASSPTRFREDANAEEDLRLGGYRDRLLVELAQNAADAAMSAGTPGTLAVRLVGGELRVANTGTPLDAAGVAALASLRASAKRDGGVGRFGVGFAAVLTVSDSPAVLSRAGGVEFSAERTSAEVAALPSLTDAVAAREGAVPILRLPWAIDAAPADGFDTEVRLPLRAGVDSAALLDGLRGEVVDLLLALPWLARIEIDGVRWERRDVSDTEAELSGPGGTVRWVLRRSAGELPDHVRAELGVEARPQWNVCWAVPVDADGTPNPVADDVLHAPTPTDERLSVPARLITTLPVEPSRRRVLPGKATDFVLDEAARCYPDFVALLPASTRTLLVPLPGFPRSEVDDRLRDAVLARLRSASWLPSATGGTLTPAAATVLDAPAPALVDLLADVLPDLAQARLSEPPHAQALAALSVARIGLAELVDVLTGVRREPSWWRSLYAALLPVTQTDPSAADELGALSVPMADGRTLPGARGALLLDEHLDLSDVDITGLRVVHPDAAHPLLERLGAVHAGPRELLESPPVRAAVERSVADAESGMDTVPLRDVVLRLIASASVDEGELPWLGALALPDTAGDWCRADELAAPGAPLLDVLAPDALGVLADGLDVPDHVLAAVGVLHTFAVLRDDDPTGPDHDLADEQDWWDSRPTPPRTVLAVRDLDLVADESWPAAIRLLTADPNCLAALRVPGGYTSWWLGRYALLAGRAPREWRLPGTDELAGLFDEVPDTGLDPALLAAIGVRTGLELGDPADAYALLDRLGDDQREIPAGAVLRAHAALAEAVHDHVLDPAETDPPTAVRVLSGDVADPADCLVLDAPWPLGVLPADQLVAVADFALAEPLAELFDLPTARGVAAEVLGSGDYLAWADLGAVVDAADLIGLAVPGGGPIVHATLTVAVAGERHRVAWWVTAEEILHVEDSPAALAAAFAWFADRWPDRHLLAALIDDPEPTTLLT